MLIKSIEDVVRSDVSMLLRSFLFAVLIFDVDDDWEEEASMLEIPDDELADVFFVPEDDEALDEMFLLDEGEQA